MSEMKTNMKKIYMIMNEEGLFSTGGSHPRFKKNGKAWTNIGHLKNHLNWVNISFYKDCRIIVQEIKTIELEEETEELQKLLNIRK